MPGGSPTACGGAAWLSGLVLIAVVAGLLVWLGLNGLRNVDLDFVFSNPAPGSLEQGVAGGVFAPLVGTLLVIVLGIAVALPLGLATAIFLVEYQPARVWLARIADTAIDLIFGVPSVVFALFGLAIFQNGFFTFLSGEVESSGKATAASFLCASLMMSLRAAAHRARSQAAIAGVSTLQREAAFWLGKGRLATTGASCCPPRAPAS